MNEAEKLQNDIDSILLYMNNDLENEGYLIDDGFFNFLPDASETNNLLQNYGWDYEYFQKIIKVCNTRSLVKHRRDVHRELLGAVALTEEGQSRAISVKHGKERSYELGSGMQIATVTVHGAAQIGNGNIQTIGSLFQALSEGVEAIEASEEEKQKARSLIDALKNNPLVRSLI